jgi:hypothetical protein
VAADLRQCRMRRSDAQRAGRGRPDDVDPKPDRTTVRLTLPAFPLEGMAEPLKVHLEFDAGAVDAILEGLILLRGQMLPPWPDAAAA